MFPTHHQMNLILQLSLKETSREKIIQTVLDIKISLFMEVRKSYNKHQHQQVKAMKCHLMKHQNPTAKTKPTNWNLKVEFKA